MKEQIRLVDLDKEITKQYYDHPYLSSLKKKSDRKKHQTPIPNKTVTYADPVYHSIDTTETS